MANSLGTILFLFILPLGTRSLTPGATSSYISAPGKVLPGPLPTNSFKVTRNVTLGQCAADCSLQYHLNQFHCYAFEFVPVTKMCVLTNVTTLVLKGGYLGLLDNKNMNYFERSKGAYINLFQPYGHQVLNDQKTYFTIFHNMTLEKCALFCLLETRDTCMSFSYSESKRVCGLSKVFYAKDNGQKLVSSDDYNHYQYFSSWPCNATIPWNYSPRAIASPYFPYASVTDIDCYLKIEAPQGRQLDLVFSTFFSQDDLCRHQDGGITIYDGTSERSVELSRLCTSDNFVDSRFRSSDGYLYIRFATGSIPFAFKAVYDIIEVDPCLSSPCKNDGTCSSDDGLFTCTCMAGFTGYVCESNIDECESSPCLMGGKCEDRINSFKCNCPSLLGGERCDKFVGLCYLSPCKNGGKCTPRGTEAYNCQCPKEWSGENCTKSVPDPCKGNPCKNGATCFPNFTEGKYTCSCVPGFTGQQCELDIDECSSNPCFHNIPCTDLVNDYQCNCPPFMAGKGCELFVGRCSENPCQHGRCIPTGRLNYTCACDASYTGSHCDSLFINYCDPNPCVHGKCSSYDNGPSCECDFGFDGFRCDQRINHCQDVNCTNGECVNSDVGFSCKCSPGFEGKYCNDTINHCLNANCNGGYCINTMTSYFCVCTGGRTGQTCDTSKYACDQTVCKHGTCKQDNGAHFCNCDEEFTGKECDTLINYCISQPCEHGTCTSVLGTFKCTCDDNYTGARCDHVIDHCKDNKCIYGFCQNLNDSFQCICAVGYHGNFCQYKPSEVEPTTVRPYDTSSPAHSFIDVVSSRSPVMTTDLFICTNETCKHGRCEKDFPNVCLCLPGFSGDKCDNFEGCSKHNPCHHGNCSDTLTGFTCLCENEYEGELCEKKITSADNCPDAPCKNGGKCISTSNNDVSFSCQCQNGFYGVHCETNVLCDLYHCKKGTCVTSGDSIRCELQTIAGNGKTTIMNIPFRNASTGSPTVSPLHQRSDLICQPNSLVISLPDTLFPEQRNITWKEDTCRVTYNGSHYVSDISLTDCGTTVLIENDTVIFSNELIVHKVADDNHAAKEREASSITFGENYETVIPVKCIYPRLNNVSTNYIPVKQNVRFIEKRYGTLDVAMQQFEDERFEKSFGTDSFPRKVPLNDDVFIRVGLNFEPNSVRVITDKCIATSSPSCADSNWQPLIISGCPKDSVSLLSTNVSSDVRFSFKAFDFRHNSSGFVYIHCEVSVCGTDDISCIMGCASRAKRSASSRQGSHLVSTGPLLIERQDDKEVVTMPTVLVVVCAVVAMASLIVAVVGWTRKHRTISAAI